MTPTQIVMLVLMAILCIVFPPFIQVFIPVLVVMGFAHWVQRVTRRLAMEARRESESSP